MIEPITQDQIIARSMKDEAFRQRLLNNPKETLERELGITLSQEVTIQVHEDTPAILHLVLPARPQTGGLVELSDLELEQAAGGAFGSDPGCCDTTYSRYACNKGL